MAKPWWPGPEGQVCTSGSGQELEFALSWSSLVRAAFPEQLLIGMRIPEPAEHRSARQDKEQLPCIPRGSASPAAWRGSAATQPACFRTGTSPGTRGAGSKGEFSHRDRLPPRPRGGWRSSGVTPHAAGEGGSFGRGCVTEERGTGMFCVRLRHRTFVRTKPRSGRKGWRT